MQITGTIDTLLDAVKKGNYTSRKLWLLIPDGQYPQTVEVECGGKQANLFDNLKAGDEVIMHVNLKGRKWTNPKDNKESVFNSIGCWKVEPVGQEASANSATNATATPTAGNYNPTPENDPLSDLPFFHNTPKPIL